MDRELGPRERRLLGAVLLSLVLHAFLMANLKPASAQFAGKASGPALQVTLAELAPGASGKTPDAFAKARSPADARLADAAARKPGFDSRLVKTYLDGADVSKGNLPDGREAALELDLPLLNQYYTAREVDQRAVALDEIPLQNPLQGPGSGKSARVVLLVLINENGGVDSVATLEARPPGAFGGLARAAFASTRFSPARKDGKPVKSQKIVEVIYGS